MCWFLKGDQYSRLFFYVLILLVSEYMLLHFGSHLRRKNLQLHANVSLNYFLWVIRVFLAITILCKNMVFVILNMSVALIHTTFCLKLSDRYSENLDGVLLAYDVDILGGLAKIIPGIYPYFGVKLKSKLLLFDPKPNMLLGKLMWTFYVDLHDMCSCISMILVVLCF